MACKRVLSVLRKACKCCPEFIPVSDDLMNFEFGMRLTYLAWRATSLVLIALLVVTLPYPSDVSQLLELVHMQTWLAIALVIGQTTEVLVLLYIWLCYPPWYAAKPGLPVKLRLTWNQYRVTYPNIFSCTFMYDFWFDELSKYELHQKKLLRHIIAFYAAVHVATTATPSHACHVFKPVLFNACYLAFTFFWQQIPKAALSGLTDLPSLPDLPSIPSPPTLSSASNAPENSAGGEASSAAAGAVDQASFLEMLTEGQDPVYKQMDWTDGSSAAFCAGIWLLATVVAHFCMVLFAWRRRIMFHDMREPKGKMLREKSSAYLRSPKSATSLERNFNARLEPARSGLELGVPGTGSDFSGEGDRHTTDELLAWTAETLTPSRPVYDMGDGGILSTNQSSAAAAGRERGSQLTTVQQRRRVNNSDNNKILIQQLQGEEILGRLLQMSQRDVSRKFSSALQRGFTTKPGDAKEPKQQQAEPIELEMPMMSHPGHVSSEGSEKSSNSPAIIAEENSPPRAADVSSRHRSTGRRDTRPSIPAAYRASREDEI